ncbi:hypothetical protein K8I28_10435, partial [bacterium]|nr:hypothetical protein [bacterium]
IAMILPIHLQDNLSKTILAHQVVDQEVAGAALSKSLFDEISIERMQLEISNKQVGFEENRDIQSLRERDGEKHPIAGFKRVFESLDDKKLNQEMNEEYVPELRKRKPEDDYGKGENLDRRI